MNNWIKRKGRYENCLFISFALFIIIYSTAMIVNQSYVNGISIFKNIYTPLIFLVLCGVSLVYELFTLFYKKNNSKIYTVKKILYLLVIILFTITIFDIIVLGTVRSFITARQLEKRPNKNYALSIRLAYICIVYKSMILDGVVTTLWLSLAGTIVGLILGLLFVTLRTLEINPGDNELIAFLKKIGRGFVKIYVTVFRGTPMMVQAMIVFYFLPGILSGIFKVDIQTLNAIFNVSVAGFVTVSLNTAAYLTEVLRGGVESLNKGQMEAARSLGMSRSKAMFYVVLPQGIRNSLPSICNEFIINIKDTSVLSVISVMDLFYVISTINGTTASNDAIFIAAIIYLILTLGISKLLGLVEKRMQLVVKPLPSSN